MKHKFSSPTARQPRFNLKAIALSASIPLLLASAVAHAQLPTKGVGPNTLPENIKTVRGEGFVYGFFNGSTCDPQAIPEAAEVAVSETIALSKSVCPEPIIHEVRILSIEPRACRSWTAGYLATAEVQYSCR